jgi:hypothetical protein
MLKSKQLAAVVAGALMVLVSTTTLSANEDLREELLNTVDNLGATAAGLNMAPGLQQQIELARQQIESAPPAELAAIPAELRGSVRILELSSAQMRLAHDPELRPGKAPTAQLERSGVDGAMQPLATPAFNDGALANPAYPSVSWNFGFEDSGEPDESETDSGGGSGTCSFPGYAVTARFTALNTAVALEAVKDIAEQACNQDILGANTSLLCVVTDIAAYVAIGIDANQELCNDAMTAAEVSATWNGLKTVHGNVQNVYDSVAAHDTEVKADIAAHDTAIAAQVGTHDSDIKALLAAILAKQDTMLGNQVTIIELLNTPQGQRPTWPEKN